MLITAVFSVLMSVSLGQPPVLPTQTVTAVGLGFPSPGRPAPQARLMARRAAEVGAVRNLYRKIDPTGRTQRVPFRYVSVVHRPDGGVEVTVTAAR